MLRSLAISAAAAVLMTAAGAFGSDALPLPRRLAYWLAGFGAGSVLGHGFAFALDRLRWLEGRDWARAGAVGLAMTLPYTVAMWAFSAWMFGPAGAGARVTQFVAPVLLISLAMTVLHGLAARRPAETHAAPAGAAPARFLTRLPARLKGAALEAVEAEDHYLRLHTDRGSDLILMRLADAVAELEGIEGARTHRSWWVAKAAVASIRRADGRAELTLACGARAPVSRTYVRALREDGWF